MDVKAFERLRDVKVQEYLCRLMSSKFEDIGNSELHPLLVALKVIKDEYYFTKPEVYRTLIAVLYDYNPSHGEEHRSKTDKYISLLLGGRPELADYLTRILPTATSVAVQDDSLTRDSATNRRQSDIKSYKKNIANNGMLLSMAERQPTAVESASESSTSSDHIQTGSIASTVCDAPRPANLITTSSALGQSALINVVRTVHSLQVPAFTSKETPSNASPLNAQVLLVKPINSACTKSSGSRVVCPASVSDTIRPGTRLILDNCKKSAGTSHTANHVNQVLARQLAPKGVRLNWPVKTRLSSSNVGASLVARPIFRTRMLIFNKLAVHSKNLPLPSAGSSDNDITRSDRASPLSCIEQLLANVKTDLSKTISDVDLGVDDVVPFSSRRESSMNVSASQTNLLSAHPLDLSLKSNAPLIGNTTKACKKYDSTRIVCYSPGKPLGGDIKIQLASCQNVANDETETEKTRLNVIGAGLSELSTLTTGKQQNAEDSWHPVQTGVSGVRREVSGLDALNLHDVEEAPYSMDANHAMSSCNVAYEGSCLNNDTQNFSSQDADGREAGELMWCKALQLKRKEVDCWNGKEESKKWKKI